MPQAPVMESSTYSTQTGGWLQKAYENRVVITVLLAFVTVLLGLIGRIMAMSFAGPFDVVVLIAQIGSSFNPSASLAGTPPPNGFVTAANVFGLASTICGALLISIATMGQTLSAFWTRTFRRGHAVVVGDTALARRVVRLFKRRGLHTLHVVTAARPLNAPFQADRITANDIHTLTRETGLTRAATIVVDAGNDAATLAVGQAVSRHLAVNRHMLRRLALRIADPLLADATADAMRPAALGDPPRPLLFDENQIMAQAQLRQLPLFKVAAALQQKRVHALIIGFGDLGEKLFDQIMLTSLAGELLPPMVTVADKNATAVETCFRARRPGVADSLGLDFVGLDVGTEPLDDGDPPDGLLHIQRRAKSTPVTCIFVALPPDSENLHAVRLLERLRARGGGFPAPIVYARRSGESWPETAPSAWSKNWPAEGSFAMTLSDEDLAACLLAPSDQQSLAQQLHETYRKGPAVRPEADLPWDVLPETYRRATLRAADHLPAKLWTLGLASDGHKDMGLSAASAGQLESILHVGETDPRIVNLARIEHERWMVERKLDGWRYAAKRNNTLLHHNLLVPWEKLRKSPHEVKKDADQVLAALKRLLEQK